jgi:hypothetical protein
VVKFPHPDPAKGPDPTGSGSVTLHLGTPAPESYSEYGSGYKKMKRTTQKNLTPSLVISFSCRYIGIGIFTYLFMYMYRYVYTVEVLLDTHTVTNTYTYTYT